MVEEVQAELLELSASFRRREIVVWPLLLVPELNYTLIIAI